MIVFRAIQQCREFTYSSEKYLPLPQILFYVFSLLSSCCNFDDDIYSLKSFMGFCGKLNSWFCWLDKTVSLMFF